MKIRIACRESSLARIQANIIGKYLGLDYALVTCSTAGDRNQTGSLANFGGKGLFVKEVEQALLNGTADIAVHSLKDMPVMQPAELPILAYSARAVANDILIGAKSIKDLPMNAKIGTCSPRRQFQLNLLRPDLEFFSLRGNINTRINKLSEASLSAIILAEAGIMRANINVDYTRFPISEILPAAGQGILAVQARPGLKLDLTVINNLDSEAAAKAERNIVAYLGANCHSPLAVFAEKRFGLHVIEIKAGNQHETVHIVKSAESYAKAILLAKKEINLSNIKNIING